MTEVYVDEAGKLEADKNEATLRIFNQLKSDMMTQLVALQAQELEKEVKKSGGEVDMTNITHVASLITMATILVAKRMGMGAGGFGPSSLPESDDGKQAYGFMDFKKAA